jgi:hypothetical protein
MVEYDQKEVLRMKNNSRSLQGFNFKSISGYGILRQLEVQVKPSKDVVFDEKILMVKENKDKHLEVNSEEVYYDLLYYVQEHELYESLKQFDFDYFTIDFDGTYICIEFLFEDFTETFHFATAAVKGLAKLSEYLRHTFRMEEERQKERSE